MQLLVSGPKMIDYLILLIDYILLKWTNIFKGSLFTILVHNWTKWNIASECLLVNICAVHKLNDLSCEFSSRVFSDRSVSGSINWESGDSRHVGFVFKVSGWAGRAGLDNLWNLARHRPGAAAVWLVDELQVSGKPRPHKEEIHTHTHTGWEGQQTRQESGLGPK